MRSDMREGPVPLEVTPLVWVFLSVLSIVVLVSIIIGASFRVSAACSNRLRAKDATAATASSGHFKNGGSGGYPAVSSAETDGGQFHTNHHHHQQHCHNKLSPEKNRNNPDIIQDTGEA